MMQVIQFKVIFRGWLKNKIYFTIALLSLIVGLTCSVLLVGFVMNEYKIAGSVTHGENVYLLQQSHTYFQKDEDKRNSSQPDVALGLKKSFPEVQDVCVFHQEVGNLYWNGKKEAFEFYSVTVNFPDFFHPKVLSGDLTATLANPTEIAITRSYALQRFGYPDPVGETMRLVYSKVMPGENWQSKDIDDIYTITTVIDDSEENFLDYKVLKGLPAGDLECSAYLNRYFTFLKLDAKARPEDLKQKVSQDSNWNGVKFRQIPKIDLVSMKSVYFADQENRDASLLITRDRPLLYIGLSIAVAILLIACFNFVNISMTRTLQRMRNTGQQVVFGATKLEMQMSLIVETGMQVLVAFLISLGFLYQVLPLFNGFMDSRLTLSDLFQGETLLAVLVLLGMVTVLPSLYIFSRLGRVPLANILKQDRQQRSGLITGMVITQFVVSLVLLITMLNVRQQMEYITHIRPDADCIHTVYPVENSTQWRAFGQSLREMPEIEAITFSPPLTSGSMSTNDEYMAVIQADRYFFDFYKLDFIAGGSDFTESKEYKNVVVNETMIKKFNITEPLGHEFSFNGKSRISGVVRDFPVDNFSKAVPPIAIEISQNIWRICLKIPPSVSQEAISKIKRLWKEAEPLNIPLEFKTLAQVYRELHENEQRLLEVVWVFTWISLLLTSLGLFGLAWFSVEKRRKEIGIRKINGATEMQVVTLLCGRFIKWIGCAIVIAVPVAFWLVHEWMMQFVYRTEISVWTFAGAGFFVVLVGIVTVIWQSWKAAVVNPVEVIKSE